MDSALAVPFFYLGKWDVGIPIHAFGVIVAVGVLIGAALLRRYAEWHGVSDDHIRGITGWITVTGFMGAHWFDCVFYNWDKLAADPLLFVKFWDGISSYGGFVGGAAGFALYVWWKRLPATLFADISIVGLLPAFSIGRIGCTVVSDHVGAFVDKAQWYAALAMDYPTKASEYTDGIPKEIGREIRLHHFENQPTITLWNLGLVEFLYLIPVNLFVLWYAFRASKRPNAGMIAVMTGALYAPVRFFLDFLRPESSDPRQLGLTFAQYISIAAFAVSIYVASRLIRGGKPAETIARTAGEAQARLRVILKDDDSIEKGESTNKSDKSDKSDKNDKNDKSDKSDKP